MVMVGRRMLIKGALGACAVGALTACSQGSTEDLGSADVEAAQTLVLGLTEPLSIDPYNAYDENSQIVVWQLFDALTAFDFSTGEVSCLAAERYEVAEDATSFTFYLREATFHDGTAVQSYDFKRAWERIVSPTSAAVSLDGSSLLTSLLSLIEGYAELASGSAQELSGVSCPDASTLQIALRTPYADFPVLLAHPALGPVPALAEEDAATFAREPVGNGPFQMAAAWGEDDELIELTRFEGYALDAAGIAQVSIQIANDTESAYQIFQTGDVDLCRCPVREARSVSSSRGRAEDGRTMERGNRFVAAHGLATSMLVCNCASEALGVTDVRRALSLAIDRSYLADTLYRETRLAADGVLPPGVAGYREAAWPYVDFDREQATELLDESYPLDDEGLRDLSFSLLYNAGGGHEEVMEAVVADFAELGITCELEALEMEAFQERVAAGDFDLARMDWATDVPVADGVLFPLFFSSNIGSTNRSGYRNDMVDEYLAEARATTDEAARQALLEDADDLIARDCPVIPLMFKTTPYVGSDRIEFLELDPQGRIDLASAELAE